MYATDHKTRIYKVEKQIMLKGSTVTVLSIKARWTVTCVLERVSGPIADSTIVTRIGKYTWHYIYKIDVSKNTDIVVEMN